MQCVESDLQADYSCKNWHLTLHCLLRASKEYLVSKVFTYLKQNKAVICDGDLLVFGYCGPFDNHRLPVLKSSLKVVFLFVISAVAPRLTTG